MDTAGRAATGLLIAAICCAAAATEDIERGTELAKSGRWEEARAAFLDGEREAPDDKRFPLELAGVEYRTKHFGAAKRDLKRALELDPSDRYANDFLGTLYYLEGNLEAALRYWNRIGKPEIADVTITPEARLNPVLLDSLLGFAPGNVLTAGELHAAQARLDALRVFASYRLELAMQPDERADATLHWLELPGWVELAAALRGAAYQTVTPEWRDIGGTGINWDAMLRWDAQKRRASTSVAGPLGSNGKWRYRWYADGRRETWNTGGAEDFHLERLASGVEFGATPGGRWSWRTGAEVSARHFGGLAGFPTGAALEYRAAMDYELVRIPERRITVGSGVSWNLGRMVSGANDLFSQGQASVTARWLPQARGDDYAVVARVRAGTTQGDAPFDELYMLGVDRDNDLWLRGHAGAVDGKKGSAPVGRNYFLTNWDFHKQLYRHDLFAFEAGPFVDTGRTGDRFGRPGFQGLMVDTGVEATVRLAGALRLTLIYGRDLRNGGHVIYFTAAQ